MDEQLNKHVGKNVLIDKAQATLESFPQVEVKPYHTFLPGQYIREIIIPAGTKAISKIHKTAHPVFVCGVANVYDALTNEVVNVYGYWKGITQPGTRRVFDVINETIITTVHAVPFITGAENDWSDNEKEALALEIENIIIEKHDIYINQGKEGILLAS